MRVAISLLVSSLVFGSLAFNSQAMGNHSPYQMLATPTAESLLAVRPKPKPNRPEKPAPHRGSGRRELMESQGNTNLTV